VGETVVDGVILDEIVVDGVPVCEELGVPVCVELGVPVSLELCVPVCEEPRVPVCVELGVPVSLELGVPVCVELGVPVSDIVVELGENCGSHTKSRLDEQPLSAMIADLTPFEFEAPP